MKIIISWNLFFLFIFFNFSFLINLKKKNQNFLFLESENLTDQKQIELYNKESNQEEFFYEKYFFFHIKNYLYYSFFLFLFFKHFKADFCQNKIKSLIFFFRDISNFNFFFYFLKSNLKKIFLLLISIFFKKSIKKLSREFFNKSFENISFLLKEWKLNFEFLFNFLFLFFLFSFVKNWINNYFQKYQFILPLHSNIKENSYFFSFFSDLYILKNKLLMFFNKIKNNIFSSKFLVSFNDLKKKIFKNIFYCINYIFISFSISYLLDFIDKTTKFILSFFKKEEFLNSSN
jgi:hypothetical protein